jgi:hypothetical protein
MPTRPDKDSWPAGRSELFWDVGAKGKSPVHFADARGPRTKGNVMIADGADNPLCFPPELEGCTAPGEDQRTLFSDWTPPEGPRVTLIVPMTAPEIEVMKRIMSLCRIGKRDYSWESQEAMAANLGKSLSGLKKIVNRLKAKGHLVVLRMGSNNAFYFPSSLKDPFTPEQVGAIYRAFGKNESQLVLSRVPSQVLLKVPLKAERPYKEKKENVSNQQEAFDSAAAANSSDEKVTVAMNIFQAIRCDSSAIKFQAEQKPELAFCAAPWVRQRLNRATKKPITNRIGFVIGLFKNPQSYGFTLVDGVWKAPDQVKPTMTGFESLIKSARHGHQPQPTKGPKQIGR